MQKPPCWAAERLGLLWHAGQSTFYILCHGRALFGQALHQPSQLQTGQQAHRQPLGLYKTDAAPDSFKVPPRRLAGCQLRPGVQTAMTAAIYMMHSMLAAVGRTALEAGTHASGWPGCFQNTSPLVYLHAERGHIPRLGPVSAPAPHCRQPIAHLPRSRIGGPHNTASRCARGWQAASRSPQRSLQTLGARTQRGPGPASVQPLGSRPPAVASRMLGVSEPCAGTAASVQPLRGGHLRGQHECFELCKRHRTSTAAPPTLLGDLQGQQGL